MISELSHLYGSYKALQWSLEINVLLMLMLIWISKMLIQALGLWILEALPDHLKQRFTPVRALLDNNMQMFTVLTILWTIILVVANTL